MMRLMQSKFNVWGNEMTYLKMMKVVLLFLPLAYCAYLMMNVQMLGVDLYTVLTQSPTESINMIVNITAIYSAYSIKQYSEIARTKGSYIALILLIIAQACFLNIVTLLLFIFYITHFIGFKNVRSTYKNAIAGKNLKVLLPALLVCCIACITLWMKLQLGLLF